MASILIIDDDRDLIRALRRGLEAAGHEVREAGDGKAALQLFAGHPTDLVISDIYMPEMNGIELLLRIKETSPDARFIAMSGGGFLEKERVLGAASMLGAGRVLEKPFTLDEALEAVEAILTEDGPTR
jgi:DNA-binding NtrC family response regulator